MKSSSIIPYLLLCPLIFMAFSYTTQVTASDAIKELNQKVEENLLLTLNIKECNSLKKILEEYANESHSSSLAQGCYKEIQNGIQEFSMLKLAELLPELITYAQTKAPRIDAPQVTSPSAIAGDTCDLTEVIRLLGIIRSRIGNVFQDPSALTVLSTLGNPLELGPGLNIVRKLLRIQEEFRETWTILGEINSTVTACCAALEQDFQETWTLLADINNTLTNCCAAIEQDFQETWTILAEISTTLTSCCADIQGTFTALEACCNSTFTQLDALNILITNDFNQTWTILADIDTTLTECCAVLEQDFQETWTLLAGINNTLTNCCAAIEQDFQETWTILAEISTTLTSCCAEIQGTFTALEACCNSTFTQLNALNILITNDFNQTWTVLADIDATLTECCAAIEQDFQETWTILAGLTVTATVDFSEVFTVLADIDATLTQCCAALEQDFRETWTILANLSITATTDLSGVFTVLATLTLTATTDLSTIFTALEACCNSTFTALDGLSALITNDFNQTWTILDGINTNVDNGFAGTFSTLNACCNSTFTAFDGLSTLITNDFNQTWTILNEININVNNGFAGTFSAINECCNSTFTALDGLSTLITNDFNQTWTILNEININVNNGFAGTFSAINECCNSTFTALDGLSTLITNDFNQTWTILNEINVNVNNGFAGTFSAINECCNSTFTQLNALNNLIVSDFNQTWTILDDISTDINNVFTVLADTCDTAITITAPTIITQPGTYCLVNDIVGTITIDANRVFLNLNEKQIDSPSNNIEINGNTDIVIKNGILTQTSPNGAGVEIIGCNSVSLENISFIATRTGVFSSTTTNLTIVLSDFRTNTSRCIFLNNVNTSIIQDSTFVENVGITSVLEVANSRNIIFEKNNANNNSSTNLNLLSFSNSFNCIVQNSLMNNNDASSLLGVVSIDTCGGINIINCELNNNGSVTNGGLIGISMSSSNNILLTDCTLSNNRSAGQLELISGSLSSNHIIRNCKVNNNSGGTQVRGATFNGCRQINIAGCIFNNNIGTFELRIISGDLIAFTLQDCIIEDNFSDVMFRGLDLSGASKGTVNNLQAINNSSTSQTQVFFDSGNTGIKYTDCVAIGNITVDGSCEAFRCSGGLEILFESCSALRNSSSGAPFIFGSCLGFQLLSTTDSTLKNCVAEQQVSNNKDAQGFVINNCTGCSIIQNTSRFNTGLTASIGFTFSGTPFSSVILSNLSDGHGVTNNYVVSNGAISLVHFTKSNALYSAVPTSLDNISVL